MGLKIDSSLVDARLSKMEATINNIASAVTVGNFAINQQIECEAAVLVITKVVSAEEPKWTTMMAKNMRQVVRWLAELGDPD
jgi:hypothetical protein